ncbi:hypothetical protein SKAU_G00401090 [Synaphobranchus kaupii]|uniref:Uncharacterized protein n=1 Tax=Synaphobranchus kaupii TaxID=118154 RepID=A0A9Q1IBK2_SYNKA|nr:hypothetical protein SKAU_G00401090 [Synaphobranchus kaupii]
MITGVFTLFLIATIVKLVSNGRVWGILVFLLMVRAVAPAPWSPVFALRHGPADISLHSCCAEMPQRRSGDSSDADTEFKSGRKKMKGNLTSLTTGLQPLS